MQVLGHSKTVCVLLGGWAFLGDLISFKQLTGMLVAVTGMILYGFATYAALPCFHMLVWTSSCTLPAQGFGLVHGLSWL